MTLKSLREKSRLLTAEAERRLAYFN